MGVGKLAAGHLQLSSLNLTGCSKVTDGGVGQLVAGFPQLVLLSLMHCSKAKDEGEWGSWQQAARSFPCPTSQAALK